MAKVKLETKQWLKDELGFSDEEITPEIVKAFEPRMGKVNDALMRQADYDKSYNELKTEREKVNVLTERLNNEAAEWATLSAAEKEAHNRDRAELEAAQRRELALQQRVAKIATDAGLDPIKALEGIDQPPKKEEPKVEPIDTSRFADAESVRKFNQFMFNLPFELQAISDEHFAITGERLDTRVIRAEIESRVDKKGANIDPRSIWEEKYEIAAKREAKAKTADEQRIKEAEQRGFERARSEAALPIAPSNGVNSPVLRNANGEAHKSVLNRPAPETGVRSAATALATGKYRTQQPAGAGAR